VTNAWDRKDAQSSWELPDRQRYTISKVAAQAAITRALRLAADGQPAGDRADAGVKLRQQPVIYSGRRVASPAETAAKRPPARKGRAAAGAKRRDPRRLSMTRPRSQGK